MNIEKNGAVSQNYNIVSTKKENYFEIQCTSKKKTNYLVFFDQISLGRHSFSTKNPMKIKNTAEVFFRITENFLEEGSFYDSGGGEGYFPKLFPRDKLHLSLFL